MRLCLQERIGIPKGADLDRTPQWQTIGDGGCYRRPPCGTAAILRKFRGLLPESSISLSAIVCMVSRIARRAQPAVRRWHSVTFCIPAHYSGGPCLRQCYPRPCERAPLVIARTLPLRLCEDSPEARTKQFGVGWDQAWEQQPRRPFVFARSPEATEAIWGWAATRPSSSPASSYCHGRAPSQRQTGVPLVIAPAPPPVIARAAKQSGEGVIGTPTLALPHQARGRERV